MMRRGLLYAMLLLPLLVAAGETGEGLTINEVMVANLDRFVDPSWNYGAWVELYNPTGEAVPLQGCWASDDPLQPKKARIRHDLIVAPGGFALLWFDHHDKYCPSQIDLKLDADGGTFLLSRADGSLLCQADFPECVPRASYARRGDGAGEWGWSNAPTPGASNSGMEFCTERLEAPQVSQPSQIFRDRLEVEVTVPEGCTLRYTTDGRTPSPTTGGVSLDGRFTVTENSVYRFALFAEGRLSSPVVTRSYLLHDKTFSLPVISVTTDPDNLYSDELGIFVRGVNGRPGNHQSMPCNWNMDWDRPCNFEYLDAEGRSLVNQEAEMKRCGAASRAWMPYSFKIHAEKAYEQRNRLDYPFFEAKPYLRHKTLQIRNGGNDNLCRALDPFLQHIVGSSGLDVDYQEYQPVAHYINGTYRGVINMREPSNKHYVYANYGWDEEEIDLFEMSADSGYIQQCGTNAAWKRLLSLSRFASLEARYEEIRQLLDIDEFCNYMAVVFFVGCTDWPNNNIKAFRPIRDDGRFRFVLYDLDWSFRTDSPFEQFTNKRIYTFNTLYGEPETSRTQEIEVVSLFLNLLRNDAFRRHFIDAYCLVAGSVFEPARCEEIVRRLATRVNDMQLLPDGGYGTNVSPWKTADMMIEALSATRRDLLLRAMKEFPNFMLTNASGQRTVLSSNLPQARLLVNGQEVPTGRFDGTLFQPVTLKAEAPAGYVFQGWQQETEEIREETLVARGATWQYYDRGGMDGKTWNQVVYNTTGWGEGVAPLGCGDHYAPATAVSATAGLTCYFRHRFSIGETIGEEVTFWMETEFDDGMVLYVNGLEAFRRNMPEGSVSHTTASTSAVGTTAQRERIQLRGSLFRKGTNLIAVEVHDNGDHASDLYWDCSLTMCRAVHTTATEYVTRDATFQLPESSIPIHLTACYAPLPDGVRGCPPVVVNEVSAGNSVYANEYAKKADWIELYNTTDEDIDLSGLYLTDNAAKPQKCRIEAPQGLSTILPAGGRCIIWCDGRTSLSQLHASFKLDNTDGSQVVLTAHDASWADTLTYCAHDGTQTVGRYPDGSPHLYRMTRPTIGKRNVLTTYSSRWEGASGDVGVTALRNSEGGLSLHYAAGSLSVKSEDDECVWLMVFAPSGATVLTQSLHAEGGHAVLPLPPLPRGVYVAHVSDRQGNSCSVRFRVP